MCMIDSRSFSPKQPQRPDVTKIGGLDAKLCPSDTRGSDPIGNALSRAYAATLAEPLPPALADLLRSLE